MKTITIKAYEFKDLSEKAKDKVRYYFESYPFDYEDKDGVIKVDYFMDWSLKDQIEFCDINEYLFDRHGDFIDREGILA